MIRKGSCLLLSVMLAIGNTPIFAQQTLKPRMGTTAGRSLPPGGFLVSGLVNNPNGFVFNRETTLMKALSRAGGFKKGADPGRVKVIRGAFYKAKKAREFRYDVNQIKQGRAPDVPIRPGDWIRVDKRPARWNIGRLFPPRSFQRGVEVAFRNYGDELALAVGPSWWRARSRQTVTGEGESEMRPRRAN